MISKKQFISSSLDEQYLCLRSLIGDIDTQNNNSLMFCQKLLGTIRQPSDTLLEYIFDEINGQIKEYGEQEDMKHDNKMLELRNFIHDKEANEKERIVDIIGEFED